MRPMKLVQLVSVFSLGFTALNASSANPLIERSGNSYHVAACGRSLPAGVWRCFAHIKTDARGNIIDGKPNLLANAAPAGLGAPDLRSAYKVTATGAPSTTIGIVDAYGYTDAEVDMNVYRKQFGLPACTTNNGCFRKVNQNGVQGSYPRQDTGWSQETALDLDMASAMCPNCKILLVEANTATGQDLSSGVNTAARLGAKVISNSYGGSELGTQNLENSYNHSGVAITASSGDSGYGVQFPASSPHVIAVGGTSLTRAQNARGWTETAWSGAGSGCSIEYAKPVWQVDQLCGTRMVADVSAVADPSTGVAVYGPKSRASSGWMVIGGTSASAPLIAGIYGLNGGTANYGADPYRNTSALFDVTSGQNGSCGGSYFCTATVGYDGPTGLGTPDGITAF